MTLRSHEARRGRTAALATAAAMLVALSFAALADDGTKAIANLRKALPRAGGLQQQEALVNDPVYQRPMRYAGYRLEDVLRQVFPDVDGMAARGAELVLRCADGYAPSMSLALALSGRGFLATRDLSRPANDPWATFAHGKETTTPAPYYLVWEGVDPKDPRYKWPYQLVELEVVSFAERYGAAFPDDASARVKAGFETFKERCISCHSVNLIGGTLAPELNVPKNVTEYWRESDLRGLIKDASSYRARSKMPAFLDLGDEELDGLLAYLKAMKARKVCGSAAKPCR